MKVLMVEHFLPESRYTLELAKELQKEVDLTLLTKKNAGDVSELNSCKKKLYPGDRPKVLEVFDYIESTIVLLRELNRKYDVVHIQFFKKDSIEIPIYIRDKKRHKNRIYVYTVHNVLPHEEKESDRKLYGEFYKTCDVLIAHNERTKKQLVEDFNIPESKIVITPHGILGDFVPAEKKIDEKVNFLIFGIVRKYKGIDIFLHAISCLSAETRGKCRFTVAGKQTPKMDSTDYVALAKELGVEDCVHFELRRIEDEELPDLFSGTDVCVFPYREIYGSGALLMAYKYQTPVIVSDVPAFIEETDDGKTGLLFKSENPESLAKAIEQFVEMSQEQREEYSHNIEKLVKGKYNWQSSAKKTAEAYKIALKSQ